MNPDLDHEDAELARERIARAGARPPIPPEDFRAIRDAAHDEWRRTVARRSSRRWILPLAAVLAGIAVFSWWSAVRPTSVPARSVAATVEKVAGRVTSILERAPEALRRGEEVGAGSLLSTAPEGRLSLRLATGTAVRLDGATRARLRSADLIEVEEGGLYVDTERGADLVVHTPAGAIRPVGTRFEARVAQGSTTLRVREGRARIDGARAALDAEAGEAVTVHADGRVERRRSAADDVAWRWTLEAAPVPPIEGTSLHAFLEWYAREAGLEVRYGDAALEAGSRETTLHGSVEHLTPSEALETVSLSSGVQALARDGRLTVTAR